MSRFKRGNKSSHIRIYRSKPGDVYGSDDVVRKIVEEARAAVAGGGEATENFIVALESLSPAVAKRALDRIAQDLRDESLSLFERLAKADNATLRLAAIEALGATRTEKAVPMLTAIAEQTESKALQKAARRSLFRLRSTGVTGAVAPSKTEKVSPLVRQPGNLQKAYMSNHDGTGHQMLEAIAEAPFGGADELMLLISDAEGIEEFNFSDTTTKAWQRRLEARKKDYYGVTLVEIPVDYFRQKVAQAFELTQALGKGITPRFARWRDILIQAGDATVEHPVYREISIVEIKWNPELLEQSPQILRNIEPAGWLWHGGDLKGFVDELREVKESKVTLPRWVEAEKSTEIIKRALERFLDAAGRARYKRRLEDLAYVFFHTERPLDAKRALAAAIGFDERSGVANEQHPFALALLAESIEEFLKDTDITDESKRKNRKLITDISEIAPYITSQNI